MRVFAILVCLAMVVGPAAHAQNQPPAPAPTTAPQSAPPTVTVTPKPLQPVGVVGGSMVDDGDALWMAEIFKSTQFDPNVLKSDHTEERLHNGTSDFIDRRPQWDVDHICGAVLIARSWVLTAKHCITDVPVTHDVIKYFKANRLVRIGSHAIFADRGTICPPIAVIAHPGKDDVALIRIMPQACTPGTGPAVPIAIADRADRDHYTRTTRLAVYGWGMTRQRTADAKSAVINAIPQDDTARFLDPQSPFLQVGAPLHFVTRQTCLKTPGYPGFVTPDMVCAGVTSGRIDQCNGDSGGPLVRTTHDRHNRPVTMLVGIVEGGDGCGLAHTPGVYVYVPYYRDWIARTIGNGNLRAGRALLARPVAAQPGREAS
jgi:secreted trypsin-like serine protease